MIAVNGTFDYEAVVPDRFREGSEAWRARLRDSATPPKEGIEADRLVGHSPQILVSDAGRPARPGTSADGFRPNVMRARVSLIATERQHAAVASVSFYIAASLVSLLRARDTLHLSRTPLGGIGLSILRDGTLVAAAGSLSAVPLGAGVQVRFPEELVGEAMAVFHRCDPLFRLPEVPLELAVMGRKRLLLQRDDFALEPYAGRVFRAFSPDALPGVTYLAHPNQFERQPGPPSESLSISLSDPAALVAAASSAMLLETEPLELTRWGRELSR